MSRGMSELLGLHLHTPVQELACQEHTKGDVHTVLLPKATTEGLSVFKNW